MKAGKIYKSEHIQPLSSYTMSPKKLIARAVCVPKIFELNHSCSEDIFKIVK